MRIHRRDWLRAALGTAFIAGSLRAAESSSPLKITGLKITPIALPDPPLLASSGCHGPYFLRNIVQVETADTGMTNAQWVSALQAQGVLTRPWGRTRLRCVTHRHIGDADIDVAVQAFAAVLNAR